MGMEGEYGEDEKGQKGCIYCPYVTQHPPTDPPEVKITR